MDGDPNRIWHRPWTTQEIIANSENWSLAGDVALLNTIKAFADNLLTKTDALNDNIIDLLHNLDEVGLKLDISQNEFQNLKNTQFIESRVYDDDEALDSKENEKVPDDQTAEKSEEINFDASLNSEMKLLDKYYEMVEISISDSEDESERSFVFKPKDVYENRQLPPLIGSDDWYKNWYIEDQTSDVDSEKSSEVYSESDSDDNLPKDLFNGSETSSELDFSNHANESRPVANSTFKDIVRKPESAMSSEESEDFNSLPAKAPISNKTFAEQLAAKLDSVISREEIVSSNVNTKPIQPPKSDPFSAGLFANEPPPLSDSEDKTTKGLFSPGKNLFDDYEENEDDSVFWDNQKKNPSASLLKKEDINKEEANLQKSYIDKNDVLPKSSQVSKGLFDSDNSDDDDDLFAPKTQNASKSLFLQPNKPIVPLFDDEPPSIDNEKKTDEPVKKKPTGGVSIFGNKDIGDILKIRQQAVIENVEKNRSKELSKPAEDMPNKKINLFDDEDDDIFFKKLDNQPNNKKINLFDDDLDNNNKAENKNYKTVTDKNDNLSIERTSKIQITAKKSKVISLFDDDEDLSNDDDIFASFKNSKQSKSNTNRNLNLFGDEDDINQNRSLKIDKNKSATLFGDEHDDTVNQDYNTDNLGHKSEIDNSVKSIDEKTNKIKVVQESSVINKDNLSEKKLTSRKNVDLIENESAQNKFAEIGKENQVAKDTSEIFKDNTFENDIKKPVSSDIPKKISLFDDDEDEDDIFSNVTKKLDFKLFEDPESREDLFNININETEKSADIKNADIKKTSEIIRNDNLKADSKSEIIESVPNENSIKDETINTTKDKYKSQNKLLLEDELFNKNDKLIDTDGKINIFEETMDKKPRKPVVAAKPQLHPTTIQTRTDESVSTEVPIIKFATSSTSDQPPPVVNLFGSTPPPVDDDDWDTKSDNFSDTEDFVSYRGQENSQRSNLFDNEPPSLNGYESSGIERDHRNTRIDTLESSFTPYASSSRRLSSDIFSDQQSQDSFFLTKNKAESTANRSHLEIITEDSKMSTIDVTPSGELEESTTSEVTPSKNDSALSNNVFLNDSVLEKGDKEKSFPEDVKDKKKENKNKSVVDERRANVEKSLNKIASITERLKNQSPVIKSPEKKGSPGKLKPTLNINVNALLPGLSQPKIKSLTKAQNKIEDADTNDNSSSNINTPSIKTDNAKEMSQSPIDLDSPIGFDVTDNVNILTSITKERVRNPARRKPSTRRARQEALRASIIESDAVDASLPPKEKSSDHSFEIPQTEEKPLSTNNNHQKDLSPEKEKPNTVLEKNSEIPRFPLVTKTELEKKLLSKPAAKINLFDSESESEQADDMFVGSTQNKTNVESKTDNFESTDNTSKVKDVLFDDKSTKEDDDLFGTAESKKSVVESKSKDDIFKSTSLKDVKLEDNLKMDKDKSKKSLFDDSSSDDDLFVGSNKSKKTEIMTKPVEKKIKAKVKKLENVETTDDPLSNLLN
ncbi:unnamed protein product [Psylliodes chrysocephalus]|uniref:FAM21/CAPZIP domain-containing protein n=1 Tax=Psylliodes chrysocephalus TaxID=3402493 RepID=A0A9P0G4E1_9CUCU|nr:unnamed protein product [Psylliodes chrysocephala]